MKRLTYIVLAMNIAFLLLPMPVQPSVAEAPKWGLLVEYTEAAAFGCILPYLIPLSHLCSADGVKDLGVAYCIAMGGTLAHELGHALMSKFFNGAPLNITLGAQPTDDKTKYLVKIGWLTIASPYPFNGGYSTAALSRDNSIKNLMILGAGPLCGAAFSMLSFALLKKYCGKKFSISECMLLYEFYSNTLGAMLQCYKPGTDFYRIRQYITE